AAVRPVISSPNWNPIFSGESVTLTCNVTSTAQENLRYSWYWDGSRMPRYQQDLIIQSARETDRGDYQCQAGANERSDSVTLDIKSNLLILQAPPAVHEGDSLSIGRVDVTASGTYGCRKDIYYNSQYQTIYAELDITVSELFTVPQIKVSPDQVTEGDHMTITCDTKLSPHRETTELQFAFYRNEHNVQGFSSSNQYGVPSAQLEDSGNYICEVQTPTDTVRKRSNMAIIQIQSKICLLSLSLLS
ncbi:hypothetical protein XELAEV_18042849mg, partial [Xenopus laevis]